MPWNFVSGAGSVIPDRKADLKKFLDFIDQDIDPDGKFLHAMRRVKTRNALLYLCEATLLGNGKADELSPDEPFIGLVARPNCETRQGCSLQALHPQSTDATWNRNR